MKRQVLFASLVGFGIGMSVTSLLKNSQQNSEVKTTLEAVKVTADVATQYVDGYNKLNDQNAQLYTLAQSYKNAKSPDEKAKVAETLVNKIKEFNLSVEK